MRALFEDISLGVNHSLLVKQYEVPSLDVPYHYHPEPEIVLVENGKGTLFVNESSTSFEANSLFMFGSNTPHLFIQNNESNKPARIMVIQFLRSLQHAVEGFQEASQSKLLFNDAEKGLKFDQSNTLEIKRFLLQVLDAPDESKLFSLLALLHLLSQHRYRKIDKSENVQNDLKMPQRLRQVKQFLANHYHEEISLEEIAELANMNKSAFCRYFKQHTRKTFTAYLNELRVEYACKLLVEGSMNITQICFEVGYNNLAYFIKQFRSLKGLTPKSYRASVTDRVLN